MRMLPVLILVALLQTACSLGGPTQPARFYALSVHTGQPLTAGTALPADGIGVGPVSLPELYERPQLVTRPADNRVELAEFERWGGNLGEDVKRVLVQDLIGRLGSENILVWPWPRQQTPALQVAVQFFRFDGEPGEQARLSGLWQLFDGVEGCRLEVHRFDISRVPDQPDYSGYVGALSLALAQLSEDIAGRLAVVRPGCRASRS
jgi:hypothetical protein